MNRKDFGALITALRGERIDENLRLWTQETLAGKADMLLSQVGALERGKRVNISPENLINLANAFQLTTGERLEFFSAASGVDRAHIVRHRKNDGDAYREIEEMFHRLRLPGLMMDRFGNVVMINQAFAVYYQLDESALALKDETSAVVQHNIMRFLFAPEFETQRQTIINWDAFAYTAMMVFRTLSFRHRAHPLFQQTLPALNRYPHFQRVWQSVSFHPQDHFVDTLQAVIEHPNLGELSIFSSTITAVASYSDLNLYVLHPCDLHTETAFSHLSQQGGQEIVYLIPDWPNHHPNTL